MKAKFTVTYRVDAMAARHALETWVSRPGSTPSQFFLAPGSDQRRDEGSGAASSDSLNTIWLEAPARWRHELEIAGNRVSVVVVDGPLWWCLLSDGRALSNAQDPYEHPPPRGFPYQGLLSPDALLEGLLVRRRSKGPRHGWKADSILAEPRDFLHPDLPRGADRYEIEVDLDHRVVRRVVASLRGKDFAWIEIPELAVDVAHLPETFILTPPAGAVFEKPLQLHRGSAAPPGSPLPNPREFRRPDRY